MFSDTGEYDGQPGSLVASCFLIRHPNGDLLWDTGLGDHFAATPGGVEVRPGVRAIVDTPLLAQLKRIGVTPTDRKSTRLNSSSLMRISYAVFCFKKKNNKAHHNIIDIHM